MAYMHFKGNSWNLKMEEKKPEGEEAIRGIVNPY